MEERNASGKFLSLGPTSPAWSINNTAVNKSTYTENSSCITMFNTLDFLTVIVAVVGMAGNATVLWLLGFHMHRNAFSVYVLNLAGADFLYLCTQTVYSLECVFRIYKRYFYFLFVILLFAYLAGLCMIAAMSTERYLSVIWPIWHHCQRPRHTSTITCALLWTFSLLLSLLFGQGCGFLFSHYERSFCNVCSSIITVFIVALFLVLSISSLALLVKIIYGSHRIPMTRFYVTISFTVLLFILFGLPFGIFWFLLNRIMKLHIILSHNVYQTITFLSCVNSCANPIVYFLVGSIRHRRLQRQTLKLLLQRAMQDTPEEAGGDRGP